MVDVEAEDNHWNAEDEMLDCEENQQRFHLPANLGKVLAGKKFSWN
jgi:hypothetical protein